MKIVAEFQLLTNWICEKYNVNLLIIYHIFESGMNKTTYKAIDFFCSGGGMTLSR